MERLKMQSHNVIGSNIQKIAQLFPQCVTEHLGKDGKPQLGIDFEKLQAELSDDIIGEGEERYQFTWPDKRAAARLANTFTTMTLRPGREESVDFDHTQNLYIEGDNLDVLKVLRETYLGKVKMIYIDPPYNTGNDFVYNDDFTESYEEFAESCKVRDEEGNLQFNPKANGESNGRFHTDWLNMMYPRLKVARDLLTEDGVIFISIDENEIENLKKICNETFGDDNHINTITLNMSNMSGPKVQHAINGKRFPKIKEYILLYSKNYNCYKLRIPKEHKQTWDNEYNLIIPEFRREYSKELINMDIEEANDLVSQLSIESLNNYMKRNNIPDSIEWKESNSYRIFASKPNSSLLNKSSKMIFHNSLAIVKNNSGQNKLIKTDFNRDTRTARIELVNAEMNSSTFFGDHWTDIVTTGGIGQEGDVPFENGKKPLKLLDRLIRTVCVENGIILDFFSGSATTAHAVMQLNAEDGGHRKFIMVQLPELTDEKSEAYKAGYKNICEIGKERIRRAGKKIKADSPLTTQNLDVGFRVLKLDSSNMEDVYYTPEEFNEKMIFQENVKADRTEEDLLFQVMLELGIELSASIRKERLGAKAATVFNVDEGYLMATFAQDIDEATITEIAKRRPAFFVMRDASASSDNVIDNFEQLFRHYSPETSCRVI